MAFFSTRLYARRAESGATSRFAVVATDSARDGPARLKKTHAPPGNHGQRCRERLAQGCFDHLFGDRRSGFAAGAVFDHQDAYGDLWRQRWCECGEPGVGVLGVFRA